MPDATPAPLQDALRAAFDAAPVAMALVDLDLHIALANTHFAALVGRAPPTLIGAPAATILPAALADAVRQAHARLAEAHEPVHVALERLINHGDADRGIHLRLNVSGVRDDGGALTHLLCTVRDVSDEVDAQTALRTSEERFASFMLNIPLTAWIVDRDGRFVYASPGFERHFPTSSRVTDHTIRSVFPTDIAEEYLRNNAEVIAKNTRIEAIESGIRPGGAPGKYFTVKFPLRDADGGVLIGGIALDMTDMAAAERSARESETRFAAIFDNAAVGIAQVTTDGILLRVNRRLAEILGYPPEELLGRTFGDITHPDDLGENLVYAEQVRDGLIDEFAMEKRYVRRDGSIVWTNLNVRCVRDAGGAVAYFVSVVEDISARRQAQDRVQQLVAEVNHRAKNMLAVVQAIARQTMRSDPINFIDRFSRRVQSLAAAQDLFIAGGWGPVSLRDLIAAQLAPFGDVDGARLDLAGPEVEIGPAAAQSIAMAVHELAATASATGALSAADGRIAIAWSVDPGGRLILTWREIGGPPPPAPTPDTAGYGAKVILDMVRLTLRADVSAGYGPEGFVWTLSAPPGVIAPPERDEPAARGTASAT